jgi:hypothetical protein
MRGLHKGVFADGECQGPFQNTLLDTSVLEHSVRVGYGSQADRVLVLSPIFLSYVMWSSFLTVPVLVFS